MSSLAFLLQCPSADAARSGGLSTAGSWCMKWNVPIVWYACFSEADRITRRLPDTEIDYPAYFTAATTLADRLTTRKARIINLLPEPLKPAYSVFYDATADRLATHFTEGVLFEVSDFFDLCEFDPDAMKAFDTEVGLMATDPDAEGEATPLSADDFSLASAFNIGTAPALAFSAPPESLARNWRFIFAGGPVGDQSWPPDPTADEIAWAAQCLADRPTRPAATPSGRPWWKFW